MSSVCIMLSMITSIVSNIVDTTLELTVVPSFSAIGPRVRRRLWSWTAAPDGALSGHTALVTGPTSGIGAAAAQGLAELGARVVLVGRDEDRLTELSRQLPVPDVGDHAVVVADTSSLTSVRAAVDRLLATESRLDVLVDNAGAMFAERADTAEGIERSLAVLVCGPFALQAGVLPLLRAAGDARVINVTSGGMYTQPVDLDDLEWRAREFDGSRAYAQSKRIQVALMREWARRFPRIGISFNAMHPGWVDTPGLERSLPDFYRVMKPILRTPKQGADTILWLATTPRVREPGGRLYLDRRPRPFDRVPQTRLDLDDRVELWETISDLAATVPTRL